MPNNLYQFTNQFRLVDVDGVFLDNPEDYILIREPSGFSESQITLKRDKDNHGFDFEYTDAEVSYGFSKAMGIDGEATDPYNLIIALQDIVGNDTKLIFQFLIQDPSTLLYEVQFEANLDFSTISIKDYKADLLARRVDFGDVFRTRIETPVDFGKDETIDGDVMPTLDPEEVFLHSKLRIEECLSTSDDVYIVIPSTIYTPIQDDLNLSFDQITFEEGKSFITSGGAAATLSDAASGTNKAVLWGGYNAFNVDSVTYTAKISASYDVDLRMLSNNGASLSVRVGLVTKSFDENIDDAVWIAQDDFLIPFGGDITGSFNLEASVTINQNDDFGKDVYFATSRTIINNPGSTSIRANIKNINNNLFRDLVNENSSADMYNAKDVFNRIIYSITGVSDAYQSDFFDFKAPDMYLTNGYKVRKFEDRNLITSFDDVFKKWAQPVFGLGRAIVGEGSLRILIERYQFFYQNMEIDYIDTVQNDTFEAIVDKDIIFNELKVGYKDFPKSTDENKNQNLDEFNSEQKMILPLEMTKKKKDYISEAITSGYLIENMRIEQFKEVPQETVSNDDKLFCVSCINSNTYSYFGRLQYEIGNTIILDGTYFDIRVGDQIVLFPPDDDGNDTFTVNAIETSSNVNDVTTILTVDETVAIEDYIGVNVTVTLPEVRLRAERNDNMQTLNDVISPETVYNVGLNPKYMLFNQSPLVNSGLNPKPETSLIKTQEAKLNTLMNCRFKSGEGDYVLGGDDVEVSMDGSLPLSDVNGYTRLFNGLVYKFTANISYQRLLVIRDSYLNRSQNADNYGYLRFKAPDGSDINGYLMELKYNPLSQQAEFTLRGQFVVTGNAFDYVLDNEMN